MKNERYINNAIIEDFAGDIYSFFDYSNDVDYVYVKYNVLRDEFKIDDTSLDLSEDDCDKIYEKLIEFVKENHEEEFEYSLCEV